MPHSDSAKKLLMDALRSTLWGLERSEDLAPDDPTLREIKSSILRRIARREREAQEETDLRMSKQSSEEANSEGQEEKSAA